MSVIRLDREELEKINSVLEKFPDAEQMTIITEQTGIGQTLAIVFDTHYNGVAGSFKVDLTDVDKW